MTDAATQIHIGQREAFVFEGVTSVGLEGGVEEELGGGGGMERRGGKGGGRGRQHNSIYINNINGDNTALMKTVRKMTAIPPPHVSISFISINISAASPASSASSASHVYT